MINRRAVCLRKTLVRFCEGLGGNQVTGSCLAYSTKLITDNLVAGNSFHLNKVIENLQNYILIPIRKQKINLNVILI
jgi:hypothetical protein